MKEVFTNLYVGNEQDYHKAKGYDNFSFVLAAKEPFHRAAVGYTGRACDKDNPEYLIAKRGNTLILNMIDANSSLYFDKGMIDTALQFIHESLNRKHMSVLICCNKAESRSPSLALLYLIKHGVITGDTLEDCEVEFLRLYPKYNPGKGIRDFVKEYFEEYRKSRLLNAL